MDRKQKNIRFVKIRGGSLCDLCEFFATFAIKICSVFREAPLRFLSPTLAAALLSIPVPRPDGFADPPEVLHKSSYVNSVPKPPDFTSAMLWGIAIADTRVPGYEKAVVEISRVQLSCHLEGKDIVLNDDTGNVRGGLYRRFPWFGTDIHDPMSVESAETPTLSHKPRQGWGNRSEERAQIVILWVGSRTDRVWHFWAASPRAQIPAESSKAVQSKFARRFRKAHSCKSAATIGAIRMLVTNRATTIMRPVPASGTSPQESDRKLNLQMFTADGVGRTLLSDAFGFALLPGSMLFSLTMDDQNCEISTHLSDMGARPTSACKIEVPCSSRSNSRSS